MHGNATVFPSSAVSRCSQEHSSTSLRPVVLAGEQGSVGSGRRTQPSPRLTSLLTLFSQRPGEGLAGGHPRPGPHGLVVGPVPGVPTETARPASQGVGHPLALPLPVWTLLLFGAWSSSRQSVGPSQLSVGASPLPTLTTSSWHSVSSAPALLAGPTVPKGEHGGPCPGPSPPPA